MPTRRACDVCYKKKIQCLVSQAGSPCDWCRHHDIICTFDRITSNKNGLQISSEEVVSLKRRVEQLEDVLALRDTPSSTTRPRKLGRLQSPSTFNGQASTSHSPLSSLLCPLPSPATPAARGRVSRTNAATQDEPTPPRFPFHWSLGRGWLFKNMRLLSKQSQEWMSTKTGQDNVLGNFGLFDDNKTLLPVEKYRPPEGPYDVLDLPESGLIRELLATYRSSTKLIDCLMPDEELWDAILDAAYSIEPASASIACIWAFQACISVQLNGSESTEMLEGGLCARNAQTLIGESLGDMSVERLQAILLLVDYYSLTGERLKSESMHVIGCRMVCELSSQFSLQTIAHHGDNISELLYSEYTRKLFCVFYTLDSDISLRTGKPPLLPEEYCDLSLSIGTVEDTFPHEHIFAYNYGLCVIKQRVSRLLHSTKKHNFPDGHILEGIRSIDSELEDWRLSLSPNVRPRISTTTHTFLDIDPRKDTHVVELQLDYYYILTVLHNIVRKCGPDGGAKLPEDLHGVIHSSVDVSLEAARSTLCLLKMFTGIDERSSYQHVISFAPVAVMSIFINVLLHPRDTRGSADLRTLGETVGFLQGLSLEKLSKMEVGYIEELCDFVVELGRLSHRAIWKMKREMRDEA